MGNLNPIRGSANNQAAKTGILNKLLQIGSLVSIRLLSSLSLRTTSCLKLRRVFFSMFPNDSSVWCPVEGSPLTSPARASIHLCGS